MDINLEQINRQIKNCSFCRLHITRINAVCGEGIFPSRFMFIAQAPGRTEDKESRLLIGPSGKVFNKLLETVHIKRNEVYITNLVKCFLPKCRKPRQDEIETCYELFLKNEIDLVKPEIIVTLGYHVTKFIFRLYGLKVPNKYGFRTAFGKLFIAKNRKIIPLRHPATVVHKSSNLEKLTKEYNILRTIQSPCQFHEICDIPKQYYKGLIPKDYIDLHCHGNWESCTKYKIFTKI